MREILFRGKSSYSCEWVEGYFSMEVGGVPYIQWLEYDDKYHEEVVEECAVILDTVGQYTGLKDKNGTRIFEGDIINDDSEYFTYSHPYGTIVYDSGEFLIAFDEAFEDVENLGAWANDIEVIGNVHDNPELLERRKK